MNEKTLKDLLSSLKTAGKPKTSAYDTTATVTRVEGGTAWVHIPGGVTETPVKLTISAKAGDTVQVRVSGGRAFMVGNASAPPTDDTVAQKAVGQVRTISKVVEKVRQVAETASRIAGNTNQYFWHTQEGTDTGAHITEIPQDEFLADPANGGGNLLARSNGIAVRDGLTELATFEAGSVTVGQTGAAHSVQTSTGTTFYKSGGANKAAEFTGTKVNFYDGTGNAASNVIAQFGQTGTRIGATGGTNISIQSNNAKMTGDNGSIAATVLLVTSSLPNDDVDYGIRLTDEHNRSYVQLTPAVNSDATAFTDYLAYDASMQSFEWRTASSYLQYTDDDGFFWQDNQGNQLASVDNDGFLSAIPKAYTPSWATNQSPANYHCVVSAGLCSFFYQGSGGTHSNETLLGTLPAGAKPKSIVFCPCVKGGEAYGLVRIETNGNVYLGFISSTSVTARLYFNCSFPVV